MAISLGCVQNNNPWLQKHVNVTRKGKTLGGGNKNQIRLYESERKKER